MPRIYQQPIVSSSRENWFHAISSTPCRCTGRWREENRRRDGEKNKGEKELNGINNSATHDEFACYVHANEPSQLARSNIPNDLSHVIEEGSRRETEEERAREKMPGILIAKFVKTDQALRYAMTRSNVMRKTIFYFTPYSDCFEPVAAGHKSENNVLSSTRRSIEMIKSIGWWRYGSLPARRASKLARQLKDEIREPCREEQSFCRKKYTEK